MAPRGFELEVCVDRVDHALQAIEAGATRIEFNQALALDGLTPSPASCRWLTSRTSVPVIAMLRPHNSGFVYSEAERQCMLADAEALLATGIAGIAFGALRSNGELDLQLIAEIGRICAGKELVLHRAFDSIGAPIPTLGDLKACGVKRVLTSGGAPTALAGLKVLAALKEASGPDLEILVAGGVGAEVVARFLQETNCRQFHGSFSGGSGHPDLQEIKKTAALLEF